jgi:MtN3 and saliva related transmembrane protein
MSASLADKIGTVASGFTVLAFLPQAIKLWRCKNAEAISLQTYALLIASSGLWTWFGWEIQSGPVIATNSFCCAVQTSIVLLKLRA